MILAAGGPLVLNNKWHERYPLIYWYVIWNFLVRNEHPEAFA